MIDYSKNLGIIGIAYFWNSEDLRRALYPPEHFYQEGEPAYGSDYRNRSRHEKHSRMAPQLDDKAGTGMGRREQHHVTSVNFHYDTGMYSSRDVLKIRYKFAKRYPSPLPFIEDDYPPYPRRYAPEMPG